MIFANEETVSVRRKGRAGLRLKQDSNIKRNGEFVGRLALTKDVLNVYSFSLACLTCENKSSPISLKT